MPNIDEKEKRRKARIEAILKKARKSVLPKKTRDEAMAWSEGEAAKGSNHTKIIDKLKKRK